MEVKFLNWWWRDMEPARKLCPREPLRSVSQLMLNLSCSDSGQERSSSKLDDPKPDHQKPVGEQSITRLSVLLQSTESRYW
jgi:hypothetical protein